VDAATVLQLDARQTRLRADPHAPDVLALALGRDDVAAIFHSPLTAADIERAIERVEDAIGHPKVEIARALKVRGDETLRRLAEAAGLTGGPDLSLTTEAVEALFTRLARQAAGAVPVADRLPEDARFAATLVLLRELMHHLRVSTLSIDRGAVNE
jgi:tRNA U34 5-methylaminomethyl-2-thiouridine-forming methyltransferase MnmC